MGVPSLGFYGLTHRTRSGFTGSGRVRVLKSQPKTRPNPPRMTLYMGVKFNNLKNVLIQRDKDHKVIPIVYKWGHPWMLLHQLEQSLA
jgi:hypothetical protein